MDKSSPDLKTTLALGFLKAGAYLPLRVSRGIGALLGLLVMLVNKKRRRIADTNLRICFPELSQPQRLKLRRQSYINFGQGIYDLGRLWWRSNDVFNGMIEYEGLDYYLHAVKQDKPVILLTSHKPGTDFAGVAVSRLHPVVSMMKREKNDRFNALLLKGRTRFGGSMIMRDEGLRPALKAMRRENKSFYYIPDEDFGEQGSVFAPFFDVPRATLTSLGRLSKMAGAVVVPCFGHLSRRGYKVVFYPPFEHFPSDDAIEDATRMNRIIEQDIRRAPAQYLWTFKWFKTRPAGEPDIYD